MGRYAAGINIDGNNGAIGAPVDSLVMPRGVLVEDWDRCTHLQKQFLIEADAGSFRYCIEDGRPIAWGATNTGNLFSMFVDERPDYPAGSVYTISE